MVWWSSSAEFCLFFCLFLCYGELTTVPYRPADIVGKDVGKLRRMDATVVSNVLLRMTAY
jgi:hypothetical protein